MVGRFANGWTFLDVGRAWKRACRHARMVFHDRRPENGLWAWFFQSRRWFSADAARFDFPADVLQVVEELQIRNSGVC